MGEMGSPGQRRGRRVWRTAVGTVLLATVASTSLAATQVTVKNPGGLTSVGPVNTAAGFPAYYQDKAGVRLEPCLELDNPLYGLAADEMPDPDAPVAFPENFPGEFFYHLVGSTLTLPGGGRAVLTLGLEAAFGRGVAAPGDQQVFARTRVVVRGATPNATLTFKHPYGELTIDTDGSGDGRLVEDISPAIGNFTTALKSNFGPFLKWDPAVQPLAPAGYVGDPGVNHAVVGGKDGYNKFSVSGGGLAVETNQFAIQGRVATNTGVTGDYAVVNHETESGDTVDYLDVFATSRGTQLQVDGGDTWATSPLTSEADSDLHYARIKLTGAAPTQVTVRNIADKPVSTAVIKLTDVSVAEATYDGTDLTVSASGKSYPLDVVGFGTEGDITANQGKASFRTLAPPPTVSVKTATGAPVTVPVLFRGGRATDVALPPVTPQPDPGPVGDNTPNNPGAPEVPETSDDTPVAAVAPVAAPVPTGGSVTLDASASTHASTFAWQQVGGPTATLTGAGTSKPTLSVPFFTTTTATTMAPTAVAGPIKLKLVVTGPHGATSERLVDVAVQSDTLTVAAGARHRLGKDLAINGTSLVGGVAGTRTPATSVVIWDVSGTTPKKVGTAAVNTLGAWAYTAKPGPSTQITRIRVQSTRGGDVTGTVATR
jgi:hypothetical protein